MGFASSAEVTIDFSSRRQQKRRRRLTL